MQLNKSLPILNQNESHKKGTHLSFQKIPNSQILIDTIALQEAKDSNEVENIVTTDDELYQSSVEFENVSQAAKEAQSYASALKLGFSIIKKNGILTVNDIKKIQEITFII